MYSLKEAARSASQPVSPDSFGSPNGMSCHPGGMARPQNLLQL